MAAGVLRVRSSCSTSSSLRSISSMRRKIGERLLAEVMAHRIEHRKEEAPATTFWLGPKLVDRPLCVGECQEALSLPRPRAEYCLVALTSFGDLFICAKDLFVEAMAGPS